MNRMRIALAGSALSLLLASNAFSLGACCAVTKTDGKVPYLSATAAHSWGHEQIGDQTANLEQQAILLKLGMPVWRGIVVQGLLGVPLRTLFDTDARAGFGGFIYGGGLGYSFPEIAGRLTTSISVSATQSHANLGESQAGESGQTFVISEIQGMALADFKINPSVALYGGIRGYSANNRLDHTAGAAHHGERMGTVSPLIGLRFRPYRELISTLEGGFGHSNVVSFGVALPIGTKKAGDSSQKLE